MPHPALRARPLGGSLRSGAWLGAALAVALGQPLVAWWWIATRGLPVGSVGEVWGWWLGLMGLLCFAAVSVMLGLVDALTHRLPNVVVAPSAVVLAVLFGSSAAAVGEWQRVALTLGAGVACGAVYLVLALGSPGGLGGGDVKLAVLIGVVLGYFGVDALVWGVVAGSVGGGVAALVGLRVRPNPRETRIAYGPWMLLGAWVGLLVARGA